MIFASDLYLFLLVLIPILALLFFAFYKARRNGLLKFIEKSKIDILTNANYKNIVRKYGLKLIAFLFIILALARPQFGDRIQDIRQESIEITIALDVSKSMLAQDVSPDRLERAKLLIASIVDENIGNKVGVIVFSGTAMWQCPVTYDLEAVKMFVQNVTTEQLPVGGTQISDAIILATKPLADTESAVNRVMVLISDGEDHDSRMSEAISQANKYHLKVLTVGVGTSDGATIPQPNGPLKDAQGVTVVSKLNPSLLKVIADETGGQYFDITDRGATANLIRAIAAVEKAGSAENPENRSRDDQFQIFLLIGILAFLLDMLVPVANKINYEKN